MEEEEKEVGIKEIHKTWWIPGITCGDIYVELEDGRGFCIIDPLKIHWHELKEALGLPEDFPNRALYQLIEEMKWLDEREGNPTAFIILLHLKRLERKIDMLMKEIKGMKGDKHGSDRS